ncbi:hypothetical protein Vadar_000720 [Vaccinium darrowii]|uniref:Uncharacterized protein n=1 Tax=Vaccinium darrowii TaxID=229202 RepID=A0ACB7Z8T1_9ERIC|nr:hypothetical protein Vadar_000720 [Vaccinium darrowii]
MGHDSVAIDASSSFNRTSFPVDFVFGTGSSAYQFEGAWKEGGKGPSIYDIFTHKYPGKFANRSNGDVAIDFYHRYKEDVQLMKFMGMDAFRFSISWSRVLPRGKLSGGVNKEGIAFYNYLIDELLSNGLKPFVTIFHWDLPQALEDEYGGWLSPRIVVKHWITINEPWTFALLGYDLGTLALGRCSAWRNNDCPAGDSATEPYIVGHHMLISHGVAVKVYKEKYQASQKGQIGITLISEWVLPYSNSKPNEEAAQRGLDFTFGWFIHPLTYGDYPQTMRSLVRKRLPEFTPEQVSLVKGFFDFIGLNYYTAYYASNVSFANTVNVSYSTDSLANLTSKLTPQGDNVFYTYPKGLQDVLIYTKEKYNNPVIYITENGMGDANNVTTKEGVMDHLRIDFYRRHLGALQNAINTQALNLSYEKFCVLLGDFRAGVRVKGFFAWSFLDSFEWASGYTVRFGLGYIDYQDGLKRYPKRSAFWFKKFNLKYQDLDQS